MPAVAPCPTCQALISDCVSDDALYSIQQSLFPFIFSCPTGYDCGNAPGFHMVCCGQQFDVTFPPGIDADTKQTIINSIVNQCAAILPTCGQNQGCANPPCDPPPPTTTLFYNRDTTCNINCPDGSTFTYTVVAGTFAALTQQDADTQAQAYACQQVAFRRICISNFDRCLCVGSAFSVQITVSGGLGPYLFSLHSGSLPDGIHLSIGGLVSGTPTASGNFTFHITAISAGGGSVTKAYQISVMEIFTTALPAYVVGTPYSYQMLAGGGSGMYQWSIAAGVFPDGISMSDSGLISGTPTAAGTNPVTFRLVDLSCQAAVQSVFPPRVQLSTRSTTQIATVIGYPEYVPSTPPKKYKKLTWSGTSEQRSVPLNGGNTSSDAKYDYSGAGEIDVHGRVVSRYQKNLSTPCPESNFTPNINSLQSFGLRILQGYCWTPDPRSCPVCQATPQIKADMATNMIFDEPTDLLGVGAGYTVYTATSAINTTQNTAAIALSFEGTNGVTNFPLAESGGIFGPWVLVSSDHNYSALLEDEYTDTEALANALVIISNGATAENLPRSTGFVSRFTNVIYTLNMTNLVVGQRYLVTVTFRSNPFFASTRQYGINATATEMSLTDVVPTPSAGATTTITSATIAFIP